MDCLSPHSFGRFVDEIRNKSDEERHEIIIDNYDTITVSYAQSYDNGVQMGSIVVLGGIQAAFDGLDIISSAKYSIGKELFGDVVESEDELQHILREYSISMEENICKVISIVSIEDFQKCIFEYLLCLALYGEENKMGIENIRNIYMSLFEDAGMNEAEDWQEDSEFPSVEKCKEELAYMISKLEQFDKKELFNKAKASDWAEDYRCLLSEDSFTTKAFAEELLDAYLEDGGLGITDFNGTYTPGSMDVFKEFFDNVLNEMFI